MADYEQVRYEVNHGVALVTLNRPEKLNAWTAQLGAELGDAMAEADGDEAVRAVVVTGAGRAFCAGADLSGGGFSGAVGAPEGTGAPRLRSKNPIDVRKPVIAALNGHAVGVGITWPLQCDVRYVASDAKLAFAFVRRGVLPELASHVILPRLCGISRASELLLSGRTFSGTEAVEYGVATRAMPADEVLPAAMALAEDMATNTAPVPVALAKRMLWEGLGIDLAAFRRKENELFAFTTRQPDAKEGPTAFFEKRAPRWSGTLDRLPD